MNENLQNWKKLSKPNTQYTQMDPFITQGNTLSALLKISLAMLLDFTIFFGWVTNAFCFSIYRQSLQYECMDKFTHFSILMASVWLWWRVRNFMLVHAIAVKMLLAICMCSTKVGCGADFSTMTCHHLGSKYWFRHL